MNAPTFPVSLASAWDNRTTPSDLASVHARIIGAELAAATAAVRSASDPAERTRLKNALPGFIAAGLFHARKMTEWHTASGLLVADIDKVPDVPGLLASLRSDPAVVLLFTSPSGTGIKAVVRVPVDAADPTAHARAFSAVQQWAREAHGAKLDPSGADVSRLCFLCHDSAAYSNPVAVPLDLDRWPGTVVETRQPSPRREFSADVERRAALYLAQMPAAVSGQGGHAATYAAAVALVHGFDLSESVALDLMRCDFNSRCLPPWSDSELAHKVKDAGTKSHDRPRGWLRDAERARPFPNAGTSKDESSSGAAWASERLLAERLAASDLRRALRFLPDGAETGWRRWDGATWSAAPEPVPVALAAAVHREAGSLIMAGALDLKVARSLESTASMRAVLAQLQAREPMRFDPASIDPPHRLATPGHVLDFQTGELMPLDPDGPAFLHRTAVVYDPSARHPLWDEVAAHVASLPAGFVVQRFLGASLIGLPPDRKLLILLGDGGDGKGTLLRSCVAAAGGFGAVVPTESLSGDGRGAHGHELLSPLATARLAYASEVPPALDWPLIKGLSGGDSRASKRMYGRSWTCQPRVWLALATNEVPRMPDQAVADRCIVVHWTKPAESNPDIVGTLATPGTERDGFLRACLRWMIAGAADFMREGLGVPDFARSKIEPVGLAGWWFDAVDSGSIVPDEGWSPFGPLAELAARWHVERGMDAPTTTALGSFLRSRLACRRAVVGGSKVAQYHARIVDGVGRG